MDKTEIDGTEVNVLPWTKPKSHEQTAHLQLVQCFRYPWQGEME